MYTRKEKEIAIELYLKNNKNATKTVWELGYPSVPTLIEWYRKQNKKNYPKKKKTNRIRRIYTEEEIQKAVDYYLENGCNVRRTEIQGSGTLKKSVYKVNCRIKLNCSKNCK